MAGITRTRTGYFDVSGRIPVWVPTAISGTYTNTAVPGTNKSSSKLEYTLKTTTDVVNNRFYYWRKAGSYWAPLHDERPENSPRPLDVLSRKLTSELRADLTEQYRRAGLVRRHNEKKKLCFYYRQNNFDSVTDTNHVGIIDGTKPDLIRRFSNFPCEYDPGPPGVDAIFPMPTTADINAAAVKCLAKSNPSAPAVNIPTFLVELKDMPDLVRQWGLHNIANKRGIVAKLTSLLSSRSLRGSTFPSRIGTFRLGKREFEKARALVKKVGSTAAMAYLTREWVIKPTVAELKTLIGFADEVSKKMQIIKDLRIHGRHSERVFISAVAFDSTPSTVFLQSNGALVYATKVVHYSKKEWCSVDWEVQDLDSFPDTPGEFLSLAKKVTTGVNSWSALSTAWELFPWSWAIDWMFGVQRFLESSNNTIGLKFKNICYMRTTTAHARYQRRTDLGTSDLWARLVVVPYQKRERKLRRVGIAVSNPFPLSVQPFLNGRAWSILGSLKILEEVKDDNTFLKFKPKKGFPVTG